MLRELLHLFLPYRSLVVPFLTLAAIVVPCWLFFRLYRARSTRQRPSFRREALLLIFVVYLSGLAYATLSPSRSRVRVEATNGIQLRPDPASLSCSPTLLPAGPSVRGFCVRNARGNVMLFFPLGLLIPLVWPRVRFWRGIQIAAAVSVGIELLQLVSRAWGSHRLADVNDVILNVLGASIGLALAALLRLRPGTRAMVSRA